MPESQFGQTPGSLEATLDELVALARHLRAVPADVPSRLTRLQGLAQMLTYFTLPVDAYIAPEQPPLSQHCRCAFDGCDKAWPDFDACLLNFAQRNEPPLWLCRQHHPPPGDGGIRPPGWQPPRNDTERTEAARKDALARLDREQLRLVNSRVGG